MNQLAQVKGKKGLFMMACGPAMANEEHFERVKGLVLE
jgi:hypothetical protein